VIIPETETPAPEASEPEGPASYIDSNVLLIAGTVVLVTVVGAAFFLALEALKALKVSVPQETIDSIGTQLVNVMKQTMAGAKTRVDSTESPLDDIAYNIGKAGTDYLIAEIERRMSDKDGVIKPEAGALIEVLKQQLPSS
jgi:hypothetical protein